MAPIIAATPPPTLDLPTPVQSAVAASPGWDTYVVKNGDSLHTIAQRHHTTVSALVSRNNLPNGGRLIHPGQRLQVPGTSGSPAPAPSSPMTATTYTVQSGDTLIGIAQRHKTTARALASLNTMSVNATIYPGQKLRVPTDGRTAAKAASTSAPATKPAAPAAPAPAKPATPAASAYTVRAGDTLSGIAKQHKTTARAIADLNKININGIIRIGQKLSIPGAAPAAKPAAQAAPAPAKPATPAASAYTVRAGDTLSGIAKQHKTSARAIADLNKININGIIRIGQKLSIPGAAPAAKPAAQAAPAPAKPAAPATATTTSYTVRAGDTLSGIAKQHKTTARAIAGLNKISVNGIIRIGQKLAVPTNGAEAAKAASSSKPATKSSTVPQPEMSTPFNSGGYSSRHFPSTTVSAAKKNHELLSTLPVPTRDQAKAMIIETAKRHGVDPALALAISYQESGWNHRQVSVANAIGLMQVIPSSGDWAGQLIGREINLLDPQDNITAGVVIIRAHLRSTTDETIAIAAYYQGMHSVRTKGMYSDTRAYVRNIQALRAKFG